MDLSELDRRDFLTTVGRCAGGLCAGCASWRGVPVPVGEGFDLRGKVARVLCLVDRGEGAVEAFRERGIALEPLFTREDLPV